MSDTPLKIHGSLGVIRLILARLILTSPRRSEMVARVQVRTITNDEGNKLLRIVRRSSGSVVTWRRAQMVLLSAQGMDVA